MPDLPKIMRSGRLARWVFKTCAAFDNVRVTELVRRERAESEQALLQFCNGRPYGNRFWRKRAF